MRADAVDQETALEHGLRAQSKWLITLNDKSAAALVQTIPALLKAALGEENVIVLFENEELM